jgi:hypothetical protein
LSGIQKTPLRIPDQWDASWFRVFVSEVMAKADVRNAIGYGLTIESDGNSVATLRADAETAGAITGHNLDPLSHVQAFSAHRAESDPHPQYLKIADAGDIGGGGSGVIDGGGPSSSYSGEPSIDLGGP